MKRTKRQENGIIISFILFLVLTIIALGGIFFYVIPSIQALEVEKETTYGVYTQYQKVKKDGQGLDALQKSIKNYTPEKGENIDSDYVMGILQDIKNDFYIQHFTNNTQGDYNSFLDQKMEQYVGKDIISERQKLLDENRKVIGKALPVYSPTLSEVTKDALTDFQFINYIESIMRVFKLDYSDSVGIGDINLVEEYTLGVEDKLLEKNIFYIPVQLSIKGRKGSILDFLYFIENVGNIAQVQHEDEDGRRSTCEFPSDEKDAIAITSLRSKCFTLNKDFKSFASMRTLGKNVFDNQMIDVSTVSFRDYIDINERQKEDNQSLVSFIKDTQKNDEYEMKIELKFYVQGLPKYKIRQFLDTFMQEYKLIKDHTNAAIQNNSYSDIQKSRLKEMFTVLESLNEPIMKLRSQPGKDQRALINTNREAYQYSLLIQEYKLKLKKIIGGKEYNVLYPNETETESVSNGNSSNNETPENSTPESEDTSKEEKNESNNS